MRFLRTGDPFAGSTDRMAAGNGALMRLAPIPLAFADDPHKAIFLAGEMSRTTHGANESIDACRYFAGLVIGALRGESKPSILAPRYHPVTGAWAQGDLAPRIASVADGSFKTRNPPGIRGTGYVVESLEAALWAFHRTSDFEAGALKAVNLGDDADTTGAIYGQLAGAFYGFDRIPGRWISLLAQGIDIASHAEQLMAMAREARADRDA
jgi:ADP-ribosylglycohydrolase